MCDCIYSLFEDIKMVKKIASVLIWAMVFLSLFASSYSFSPLDGLEVNSDPLGRVMNE